MKKTAILLGMLCMYGFTRAQLTLQPGATWVFEKGSTNPNFAYGEKWEYLGDSAIGSITIHKIHRHYKFQTIPLNGGDPVYYDQFEEMTSFWSHGDTAFVHDKEVVNFSLQVGDTTLTAGPMYDPHMFPFLTDYCDSTFYYSPAVVTETGTESINGNDYRYYSLNYLEKIDANGDSTFADKKFSEYSWIVSGYWVERPNGIGPDCLDEWSAYQFPLLACYFDDQYSQPAVCDLEWFETLVVAEPADISNHLSVYPNPATDMLNVSLPKSEDLFTYRVLSADGKLLSNGKLVNGQLDIGTFPPGMYFLLLQNDSQNGRITFVKQ